MCFTLHVLHISYVTHVLLDLIISYVTHVLLDLIISYVTHVLLDLIISYVTHVLLDLIISYVTHVLHISYVTHVLHISYVTHVLHISYVTHVLHISYVTHVLHISYVTHVLHISYVTHVLHISYVTHDAQDELVEIAEITLNYPSLFVAVYNYIRYTGLSDEDILQSWRDFLGEEFGHLVSLDKFVESIRLTVGLDKVPDFKEWIFTNNMDHLSRTVTVDDPEAFIKTINLARSIGIDENTITRVIGNTIANINDLERYTFQIQEFTENLTHIRDNIRYKHTLHMFDNITTNVFVGPSKIDFTSRQIKKIKDSFDENDTAKATTLINDLIEYLNKKEDRSNINNYLNSQVR